MFYLLLFSCFSTTKHFIKAFRTRIEDILSKNPPLCTKNPAFCTKNPLFSPQERFTSAKQEKLLLRCLKPCQTRTPLATLFWHRNCPLHVPASLFMAPCAPALVYWAPSQPSSDPEPKKTATSCKQYECKTTRKHVLKLECTSALMFNSEIRLSFHIMAPQKSRSRSDPQYRSLTL